MCFATRAAFDDTTIIDCVNYEKSLINHFDGSLYNVTLPFSEAKAASTVSKLVINDVNEWEGGGSNEIAGLETGMRPGAPHSPLLGSTG